MRRECPESSRLRLRSGVANWRAAAESQIERRRWKTTSRLRPPPGWTGQTDENGIQPLRRRWRKSAAPSSDPTNFQIQAVSVLAQRDEAGTASKAAEERRFLAG